MKNLTLKIITINWLLLASCTYTQVNCETLSKPFKSHQEAIETVKETTFVIQEDLNTSKSSWIKGASFYSCDSKEGYFILTTSTKEYIYYLPIEIWREFKQADSFGSYYDKNIKGEYHLKI